MKDIRLLTYVKIIKIGSLTLILLFFLFYNNSANAQCEDWVWAKNVGINVYYQSNGITTDDSGNVFYTGFYYGSFGGTIGGGSGRNLYLVKYDRNGNQVWATTTTNGGNNTFTYRTQINTDASGNIIVAGCFIGTLDFGPYHLSSNGSYDIYIAKFDPTGQVLWAMKVGGSKIDVAYDLHVYRNGNIAIAGYFSSPTLAFGSKVLTNSSSNNNYDMFVAMLRPNGSAYWAKQSTGGAYEIFTDICGDDQGNLFLAGFYNGNGVKFGYLNFPSSTLYKGFLMKLNIYGVPYWVETLNGSSVGFYGHNFTIDISGNIYMTGLFNGSMTFNNTTVTSNITGWDIYIFKMDANRNVFWGKNVGITGIWTQYGASTIATDLSGGLFLMINYYNSGFTFGSSTVTNRGSYDMAILKFDSSGNEIRANSIGGDNYEFGGTITSDKQGNIIVQGGFYSSILYVGSIPLYKIGTTYNPFIAKLQNRVITDLVKADISCHGDSNGVVDLTVSGTATPPYSFLWSTGETTEDIGGQGPGAKIVKVTDANGCVVYDSVVITEPNPLTSSYKVTDNKCNAGNTGKIDLTVTGGTYWYHYLWSTSVPTQDLKNLSSGIYSVLISDRNGCTLTDSVTVSEPSALELNPVITDLGCYRDNLGAIDLSVTGGVAPYSYSWSTGDTIADINNLNGGDYIITLTDTNNCTLTDTLNVYQPFELTLNHTVYDLLCYGDADGSVDMRVSGGTAPFRFNWSSSETTEDLSNLSGGSYTVVLTDKNNCISKDSVFVFEPTIIELNTLLTQISCNGNTDGSIKLNVTGGTPFYNYAWSIGSTKDEITDLLEGTYNVTVTDSNNCVAEDTFRIIEPKQLAINAILKNVSCYSYSDGQIDISVAGGTLPYYFNWSTTDTVEDINFLNKGNYNINIIDAHGCVDQAFFSIIEPPELFININVQDVKCNGGFDGAIDLNVTGGTPPYQFAWTNGETTEDISNLVPDNYIFIMTESNGCITIDTVTINEPALLSLTYQIVDETCEGDYDGSIDITVSGGVSPYSFSWSSGHLSEDISNIGAGSYIVDIHDNNNCSLVSNPIILDAYSRPKLDINPFESMTICHGDEVTFTIPGNNDTPVQWSTGENSIELTINKPGNYFASYTNSYGCQGFSKSIVIKMVQDPKERNDFNDYYYYCSDSSNLYIEASYFKDAEYLWEPTGDTSPSILIDQEGKYMIRISIDKCIAEEYFEVVELCKPVVYIPNAFTPNHDGINDTFTVSSQFVDDLSVIVFDRWGRRVFEGEGLQTGWDGKFGGDYIEPGALYYYVNYSNRKFGEYTESGVVLLLK